MRKWSNRQGIYHGAQWANLLLLEVLLVECELPLSFMFHKLHCKLYPRFIACHLSLQGWRCYSLSVWLFCSWLLLHAVPICRELYHSYSIMCCHHYFDLAWPLNAFATPDSAWRKLQSIKDSLTVNNSIAQRRRSRGTPQWESVCKLQYRRQLFERGLSCFPVSRLNDYTI